MLRLTASASDHGFVYALARSGAFVVTTGNRNELGDRMLQLTLRIPASHRRRREVGGSGDQGGGEPERAGRLINGAYRRILSSGIELPHDVGAAKACLHR